MKETTVTVTNDETGESRVYRIVGTTYSGSRGYEWQLSLLDGPPGQIQTVCHRPPRDVGGFTASGNTYKIGSKEE